MGLGFYTGLRNRNTRIRERKETLEDQQAQRDLWQTQFDSNAEQTMKEIRERNRLATKISETEAEAAITAADVEFGRKKEILGEEQDFELKKIQVNFDNTLEKMGIESGYADGIADKNIAASMKELIIRGEQNLLLAETKDAARMIYLDTEHGLQKQLAKAKAGFDEKAWEKRWDAQVKHEKDMLLRKGEYEETTFDRKRAADKEDALELAQDAYVKQINLEVIKSTIDGTKITSTGKGASPALTIKQTSAHMQALGISDENIAKLAALNNPTAITAAYDTLRGTYNDLIKEDYSSAEVIEMFKQQVDTYFNNLSIVPGDTNENILKKLEETITVPLDEFTKTLIMSQPEQNDFSPLVDPVAIKKPSMEDILKFNEYAEAELRPQGSSELNKITKATGMANRNLKASVDANEQAHLKQVIDWLGTRSNEVSVAMESAKGKNPDLFPLVQIFGNRFLFDQGQKAAKVESDLPVLFREVTEAKGVFIPATTYDDSNGNQRKDIGKMLQSLEEVYGVLKVGDIIRYLKNPLDPDSEEITDVYEGSGN
tara:strand:- start:203 stop:1834 length:1632 start_codon:yes stop_codon:yes gene_type:complete